ncbi:MAG: DUF881 domain-containing protein [Anaeromicrobium sp.]|uniref:DUF881 domain-containing protein n=1 Tax=Anaeromicrobium sp. TaxID=1929132 RepID=UPI0025F9A66B|nr:DUF881 domain-containing protein [Anaeromicrobium sp.]MCT4592918.1 DUF881 domain-containing protein [Anaeromicrobium sp.]
MNSKKGKWVILFFCLILGITISLELKNVKDRYLYAPLKEIHDYKITLESEKQEIKKIKEVIKEMNKKILAYEKIKEDDGKLKYEMLDELKNQRAMAGFSELEGPGIILTVDDSDRELFEGEDPNNVIVHDADVLNLVNDLKVAGAEAISINGQRIINTTELVCAGHSIRINNQFFAQPFVIKAIGEPKTLEASLIAPTTYGALLKEFGLYIEVNTSSHINIPAYDEGVNVKYMKVIKEGE